MTINNLQRRLIEEIERITADMSLVSINQKKAMLKGYPQAVPVFPAFAPAQNELDYGVDFGDESQLFPYFIVRADGAEYQKTDGQNEARIMIAFAIFDDNPEMKGYFTLTAVMERVIMRFQSDTVLGPFFCSRKINMAFQEDETYPHFFGAIEMTWYLPEFGMEELE